MRLVLGMATVLGVVGPVAAFGLFYLGQHVFDLNHAHLQTLMYLLLSVAGHLTIFLTRTRGPFWSIRPARIVLAAVVAAQAVATGIAVGGIFVTPLRWYLALFVWGYAIVWFLATDRVKLLAYRRLDPVADTTPPSPGVDRHAPEDGPGADASTAARVGSPFHTNALEYPPHHRNVYHDNEECRYGKEIKSAHRVAGTGNRPRCEECSRLARDGR